VQERCQSGRARAQCICAFATGAFCAGGTDKDRLTALCFLAGLWLTQEGADLEAALTGWSLVMTSVDVRTLSTPLIDATLLTLSQHLAVCPAHHCLRLLPNP
jgi:hypothetical protein